MAFQNAQEPTEEPWGPNITEEEIDDEAARGGVDLDATEKEIDDNANKEGGEVVRQYLRSPVNPV
ncbi:hypothetical protein X797_003931, partial [Metarhizium robertsii]